ncbi:hypothetical protein P3T23_001935 [Paraburkholderia sp. GAS448]|uniref:lactonase family protein n=1 Tax=Paraburkholderia sp. GAS448 TaxID=3035136 RepID=UPI003D1A8316
MKFAPEGNELLVTEKGTQLIDTYSVGFTGYASTPTPHASNGVTPFGFSITIRGYAIVSEAGSGSVSSYEVEDGKHLTSISAAIPLGQSTPCWPVTTGDGRFAYTANAGSGTISSLRIAADGTLSLLNPSAGTLSAPLDMALSSRSKFLYVREGNGAVSGFRVTPDGTLEPLGSVTGIPPGAQGIAARQAHHPQQARLPDFFRGRRQGFGRVRPSTGCRLRISVPMQPRLDHVMPDPCSCPRALVEPRPGTVDCPCSALKDGAWVQSDVSGRFVQNRTRGDRPKPTHNCRSDRYNCNDSFRGTTDNHPVGNSSTNAVIEPIAGQGSPSAPKATLPISRG